jgi:two-component system, NtrC family, response regulator
MDKILVVDDSEEIRSQLKWGLEKDHTVLEAADCPEALAQFKKHIPRVVTLDLGLPPDQDGTSEGFSCLETILNTHPQTKVIVLTGNDQRETAYQAIQRGAYDYYQKPIDLADLKVIISRAFHLSTIEGEKCRLEEELDRKSCGMEGIIGDCSAMQRVFGTIKKVATTDVPVLVTGESGTGKELVARALHCYSLRSGGSFVPINCGAIPENLLESELFGAEKGAFTGAFARVQGKVEYADKGTLFLDEIGELPLPLQVKLLRFLQDKTMQRVGGRDEITVDARIISATNQDIGRAREGLFREDLYYRIAVVTIELPPLRKREGDLRLLANYFLHKSAKAFNKKVLGFSSASFGVMESYAWPGNVRELQNRVQRGVIMSDTTLLGPDALGFSEGEAVNGFHLSGDVSLREARESVEREVLLRTLKKLKGNVVKASETLGVSRPTLYELMRKHGITSHLTEQ